jgi:hypothetical protein
VFSSNFSVGIYRMSEVALDTSLITSIHYQVVSVVIKDDDQLDTPRCVARSLVSEVIKGAKEPDNCCHPRSLDAL